MDSFGDAAAHRFHSAKGRFLQLQRVVLCTTVPTNAKDGRFEWERRQTEFHVGDGLGEWAIAFTENVHVELGRGPW